MRRIRLVPAAATVLGVTLAGAAMPGSAEASVASSGARPQAQVTAARRTPAVYAAVVADGSREYLRLVSTRTGAVTATLGSGRGAGYFNDIDLAPDGSVYAATSDTSMPRSYQTRLRRYTKRGVTNLQPYIRTVKIAPDGKSLATTALSPDGDGDGYALEAVRISALSGVKVRDLMTNKVPVWGKGTPNVTPGGPAINAGGVRVLGWLPGNDLAADWGCCDSGRSWVMSSTRKNQSSILPPDERRTLSGTFGTTIIGYKGASVLQIHRDDDYVGLVRWGTARTYRGRIVGRLDDGDYRRYDAVARRHGATPLRISPTTYPYTGRGRVVQASL